MERAIWRLLPWYFLDNTSEGSSVESVPHLGIVGWLNHSGYLYQFRLTIRIKLSLDWDNGLFLYQKISLKSDQTGLNQEVQNLFAKTLAIGWTTGSPVECRFIKHSVGCYSLAKAKPLSSSHIFFLSLSHTMVKKVRRHQAGYILRSQHRRYYCVHNITCTRFTFQGRLLCFLAQAYKKYSRERGNKENPPMCNLSSR